MNDHLSGVASPCIRNCCLTDDNVCLGCFRLLDEITRWSEADDAERSLILKNAKARKLAHAAKYNKWKD